MSEPYPESAATALECRHHPGQAARLVCTRCGDYICAACRREGVSAVLCEACAERVGELVCRVPWGIGSVLSAGFASFKHSLGVGLRLGLLSLLVVDAPTALSSLYADTILTMFGEYPLVLVAVPGVCIYACLAIWVTLRVIAAQAIAASQGIARRDGTMGETWQRASGSALPLFFNLLLLPGMLLGLPFIVVIVLSAAAGPGVVLVGGFGLLAILLFWLVRIMSILAPVTALERPGGDIRPSLRAFSLTRGKGLQIFVVFLVMIALAFGAALIAFAATFAIASLFASTAEILDIFTETAPASVSFVWQVSTSLVSLVISYPNACICVAVYHGLRGLELKPSATPLPPA